MANKCSIVMASYKQANYLALSLNSLLDQIFQDIEIIVVCVKNDNETLDLVSKYPVKTIESEKADFIHQRNLGIEAAQGQYVTFADSDDFFLPTKIEQEITLAEEKQAVLVYSTYIRTDHNLMPIIIGGFANRYIYDIPIFPPPTYQLLLQNCYIYDYALVLKSMYEEFGLLNTQLKQAAMYDKWLHIMETYPHKVAYNPYATFLYRTYPSQMHLTEQQRPEHSELMQKVRLASLQRYQDARKKAEWQNL